jgi:ferritin-like metal-binding protein YciE
MNVETLEDLFGHQLQRAYYVERTHAELLAEMAADAASDDLEERFATHRDETERQIERLERVFAALGRQPRASRSRTADGFAESRHSHTEAASGGTPPAHADLAIGLAVERLEIRSYEGLLTLAGRLAYADDVVEPLEVTLEAERAALRRLEDLEAETPVVDSLETGP